MKILRVLIIIIVILVVITGLLALIAPKEANISRSVTINAPKSVVFGHITHFKDWTKWSPWHEMDPDMQITYTGEDGQTGSGYHWVGTAEKKTGEGEMTNAGISGDTMKYQLSFLKPWKSEANGSLVAADAGNNTTRATWTFHTDLKFPGNIFALFMNMDKMLGKDFEHGLDNLKILSESNTGSGYEVSETQFPGHTYITIRKNIKWDEMEKFFGDSYAKLGDAAGKRINGPASCLVYMWDTTNHAADIAAAMPVSEDVSAAGTDIVKVPATSAYMMVYTGAYSGLGQAHGAINAKLAATGKKSNMVVEEYIKGPSDEKDSTKWVTNIYYLLN